MEKIHKKNNHLALPHESNHQLFNVSGKKKLSVAPSGVNDHISV